jgi:NAD(P)-dependent dehydrogenase (short-subunit alcohol dehydrogenase family)
MTKFFEFVAQEHSPSDVQIVVIHPGTIKTAMSDKADLPEGIPFDDGKPSRS